MRVNGTGARRRGDACPYRHVLASETPDLHADNDRLRAAGPLVPVVMVGGVRAWAATRYSTLQQILTHPAISKDITHWADYMAGRVPPDWPLLNIVAARSLITAEGEAHNRLRGLVSRAFTPRRVHNLEPRISELTLELLDDLAEHPPGEPVDVRAEFAYPLPRNVICELVGMPREWRAEMDELSDTLFRVTDDQACSDARMEGLHKLFRRVIELRRREPGDDLTSALIAARDEDGDRLTEEELYDTVMTMFIAGHETTVNLITNAIRALLAHPDQLALLRDGKLPWSAAVEETLRWDSPVAHFPMRYVLEDVEIDGVRLSAGDAVLSCYAAVGRDPDQFGEDAARFDVTRDTPSHLSFGHGPHFCVGAALARTEAELGLAALFTAFPDMTPAVPLTSLRPLSTVLSNSVRTLPVYLTRP
ncbi:cytochrome P450 [Thermocatellispora tengchongensis]|uniref:Cytochrome P450 n=1 Tax=Thermocatellispora tengchongensis TaxID=1073253 RepID=A0A840P7C6_9ACTN|nr:cytochrome P450 [Thermocatellispora tengchongensis]MBB5133813.1 cytochrome P450 [Thermocatellispora tengchongensis]